MYFKTLIICYITILLSETCECNLICPPKVKSFSIGPYVTQYYICDEEGGTPVLQHCPDNEVYWPLKGICTSMSNRNSATLEGNSDLRTFTAPVLGNPVYLGCLYDARSHEIMAADSFWDRDTVLKHKVQSYSYSENVNFYAATTTFDRLNTMNVDVSLQLEFLDGLIQVEGSASFLRDSVESEKTLAVVMKAHYITRSEMLPIATPLDYIKLCSLKGPTHVVTTITYGMDANFVYKKTARKDERIQDIAGSLKIAVKSVPGIKIEGKGEVKINETLKKFAESIDVKLFGDFVLDKQPTTYEESIRVFKNLTIHLGKKPEYKNSAKMKMQLTPITRFCDEKTAILISISDSLLHTVAKMLDEMEKTKLKAKTLLMSESVINYLPLKSILSKFMNQLGIFELGVKGELQTLLPNIRGGGKHSSEKDLVDMFTRYRKSPFYFDKSESFLKVRTREIEMIDFILDPSKFKGTEVNVLNFEKATDDKILFTKPYITMVRYNILPSLDIVDRFLNNETVDETKSWFNDQKVVAIMGKTFKSFMNFVSANAHTDNQGFLLALFNEKSDFLNVFAQREGDILSSHFDLPNAPPKMTPSSNMFNAILFDIKKPGNTWVTGFTVRYWKFAREESVSEVSFSFTSTNTTTTKITGLAPNDIYQFSMRYETLMGHSPTSPNSAFIVTRPCSPPTNIQIKMVMPTSFDLQWDEPSHIGIGVIIHGYEVVVNGNDFMTKITVNESYVSVKGTSPASVFTVTVVAVVNPPTFNESSHIKGISRTSLPTKINVVSAPDPPSTPNLVSVSFHSAEITWNEPAKIAIGAHINDYLVQYVVMDNLGKVKYVGTDIVHSSGNRTFAKVQDLIEGTTYGVKVKVVTTRGESPYSSILILKTKFKQTELDQLRNSVKAEIQIVAKEEGDKIKEMRSEMNTRRREIDNQFSNVNRRITGNHNLIEELEDGFWVYFPKGTRQYRARPSYPEYDATFIGHGERREMGRYKQKWGVSIKDCVKFCYGFWREDTAFNTFAFYSTQSYCECNTNAISWVSSKAIISYKFGN